MTADHYDAIQEAKKKIERVRALMPKCEACGIDTQEYGKIADMAENKYKAIEKTWFPKGRPTA